MLKSFFKKSLQIVAIFILFAENAQAVEPIQNGQISFVFTDREGLSWTSPLPGSYTNGCDIRRDMNDYDSNCMHTMHLFGDNEIVVDESEAAKACRELRDINGNLLGTRLPTIYEMRNLIRSMGDFGVDWVFEFNPLGFANTRYPKLLEPGQRQFLNIFGDLPWTVWTSTLYSGIYGNHPNRRAHVFQARSVLRDEYRYNPASVICVSDR